MLDQSFSAKNFETIFTLLNRQGKVEIDAMSEDYRAIVGEIHAVNEEIKLLCRKKKALRTEDEVSRLSELQESLSSLRYKKSETLIAHMEALADEVNSRLFAFNISTSVFVFPCRQTAPTAFRLLRHEFLLPCSRCLS